MLKIEVEFPDEQCAQRVGQLIHNEAVRVLKELRKAEDDLEAVRRWVRDEQSDSSRRALDNSAQLVEDLRNEILDLLRISNRISRANWTLETTFRLGHCSQ